MRLFSDAQLFRSVFASQWEEAARLVLPTSKNTFYYGSYNFPGQKKTQEQIDASGMLALHRFCAICDSLVTPKNDQWHALVDEDDDLMKNRQVAIWYEQATDILFKMRYAPTANFSSQNYNAWQSLGAFGNSTIFVDTLDGRRFGGKVGLRYRGIPLGETFFLENHQGIVDTMIRWFRLSARQAVEKFGIEWLPANLRPALEIDSQTPYNFLHCVRPRDEDDYDPARLDERSMPFESYYLSIEGSCLMGPEGGYRTFPFAVSRYDQTPGEIYGRGWVQLVLPSLKTLNAQKTTYLKQAHRNADPVLLTADDMIGMDLRPGAMNKGGVSADGKPLVHVLPAGNMQVAIEMMQEERGIIDDVALVSLFKVLTDHPDMTATQVVELVNEKAMLVAPTLGRQHDEKAPMVLREHDLLTQLGAYPPMPIALQRAGSRPRVVDTSPLSKAANSNKVAGFMRSVEFARQIAVDTQDPSPLYYFNFGTAMPEIARYGNSPVRWMATDQQVAAKQKAAANAKAQEQQIQELPARAAMMKAQAVALKAGQPTQQPGAMQ